MYNPFINTDGVIEQIQDDAYDNCGEVAENFLGDATKEEIEELNNKLNDVLNDWLAKHSRRPTFENMVDAEELELDNSFSKID